MAEPDDLSDRSLAARPDFAQAASPKRGELAMQTMCKKKESAGGSPRPDAAEGPSGLTSEPDGSTPTGSTIPQRPTVSPGPIGELPSSGGDAQESDERPSAKIVRIHNERARQIEAALVLAKYYFALTTPSLTEAARRDPLVSLMLNLLRERQSA